jgi:CHAT domain-containing protein
MQRWGILVQVALGLGSKRLNDAALSCHKEALGLALTMQNPLLISRSYGYVGSAYASREIYDEALASATRAFEIGRAMSDGAGGAEIMANASQQFGDILRQSGDCGRAIEAYDRSIRLYGGLKVEYYSYMAHRGKLLCFMDAHDDGAAGEELRTVLSLFDGYRAKITADGQRNSFFDQQQGVYDLAIRYGLERMHDPDMAFRYSEEGRARSLLELLRHGGKVLNRSDGPDLSLTADTRALTLEEIKDGLPEQAQVLQYAVLEDKLLIWVVTKSGVRIAEAGVGAQELAEKVRAYLALASTPPASADDSALAARAADLYRVLVAPAEQFLDKSKFLCIVPDKVLHYLPYEALVSPATGNYLMEDYDLGFAPSTSIYVAKSAAAAGEKAGASEETLVSIGEPSFSRAAFPALPALPSAAREAEEIKDFYGGKSRVLLHGEASEQSVKSELRKADVAHFAMHYLVDENSEMLSGFPLAPERAPSDGHEGNDGFLQSYEIYKMELPRLRLVVLSACQTGIERQYGGEGAVGVARPFLVAGAASVVASLWPVDTAASAELMIDFHRQRRRGAIPATEALRRAQRKMARGPDARRRHPYYWAPFVVIGGHAGI